ncbi:hypothetical protein Bbelb_299880 [Branchiostoma belcheri]|nr:hypothetical protein Bbelb_299880 [Branchiostoma belcheri]
MAMDVDALEIAKSVEKRLEYYMNVKRLEEGFDPTGQGIYRTSHRMAPYDLGHLLVSTKKPRRFRGKITQKLNPQETPDGEAKNSAKAGTNGRVVKEKYVPQVARSDSGFESRSGTPHIPKLDINGKKSQLTSKGACSDHPSLPLTPRQTSSARHMHRVPVLEADRLAKHATKLIETLPLDQLTAMHSSRFHPVPQPHRPRHKDVSPRASSLSRNVHALLHGTATREYISKTETQRVKSARAYRAKSAKPSPPQPTKPDNETPRSKSALGLHRLKTKPTKTVTSRVEDYENNDDDESEAWTSEYLKDDDTTTEEAVFKEMPRGAGTTVQLTGWLSEQMEKWTEEYDTEEKAGEEQVQSNLSDDEGDGNQSQATAEDHHGNQEVAEEVEETIEEKKVEETLEEPSQNDTEGENEEEKSPVQEIQQEDEPSTEESVGTKIESTDSEKEQNDTAEPEKEEKTSLGSRTSLSKKDKEEASNDVEDRCKVDKDAVNKTEEEQEEKDTVGEAEASVMQEKRTSISSNKTNKEDNNETQEEQAQGHGASEERRSITSSKQSVKEGLESQEDQVQNHGITEVDENPDSEVQRTASVTKVNSEPEENSGKEEQDATVPDAEKGQDETIVGEQETEEQKGEDEKNNKEGSADSKTEEKLEESSKDKEDNITGNDEEEEESKDVEVEKKPKHRRSLRKKASKESVTESSEQHNVTDDDSKNAPSQKDTSDDEPKTDNLKSGSTSSLGKLSNSSLNVPKPSSDGGQDTGKDKDGDSYSISSATYHMVYTDSPEHKQLPEF